MVEIGSVSAPEKLRKPTFSRSVRLFRAFLKEQSDPDHFYRILADDSVAQVSSYVSLKGSVVLDVGGGPGYFAEAFRGAGCPVRGSGPGRRRAVRPR